MILLRLQCWACGGYVNRTKDGLCGSCASRPWEWKTRPVEDLLPVIVLNQVKLRGEPCPSEARREAERARGGQTTAPDASWPGQAAESVGPVLVVWSGDGEEADAEAGARERFRA
jgi:hypothetical protein